MTEEESIEIFKNWLEYNKKHKNILREADKIIAVQETILDLIQKLQEENKKKDKIIDLMAEFIDNNLKDCLLNILQEKGQCEDTDRFKTCKDCIKQYFEKKAIQEEN